jgi:hypothetical protein
MGPFLRLVLSEARLPLLILGTVMVVSVTLYGGETDIPCRLEQYIDEPIIINLAEAKDLVALRTAWDRLPYRDLVQRVVFYTRIVLLGPGKLDEVALLETLPSSPLEFRYIYAINDTKAWKVHPALREVYSKYFESIGRLAAKHPEYIERLLVMNRFADGEAKNSTDEATRILKQLNPSGYLDSLKRLDADTRAFVCGDCAELQNSGSKQPLP